MTISNHLTLEALTHLSIGEIAALPAIELARLQTEADEALRKAKRTMEWLDCALAQKYAARAKAVRAYADKDFGVARFTDGEVIVVAELPKKIEWDQKHLSQLSERIEAEGDDPREYVEVTLKVSERAYAAWPTHLRTLFAPARTVRPGKETIRLIVEKEGI